MRNSPCVIQAMFLFLIICLLLVSGCTSLGANSNPPALITDIPKTVSPASSATVLSAATAPGGACAEGQTTCSGACRNTLVDSSNCGRCGNTCSASQYCNNGICTAVTMAIPVISLTTGIPSTSLTTGTSPGVTCSAGQALCSGVCRNTLADASNCGACGRVCSSGQTCNSGTCVSPAVPASTLTSVTTRPGISCSATEMNCGGTCVSRHSDTNCGVCGNECGTGSQCSWSTHSDGTLFDIHCICNAGSGLTLCSGFCHNLQTDVYNCGSCGNVCPGISPCCGGICRNIGTDNNNCGGCGNVCTGGRTCISGMCWCASGQSWCSGACVNYITDPGNCGGCGIVCPAGQSCAGGVCTTPACGKDLTPCSAAKGGTVCVNLNTDSNNCGSCGNACITGSCSGGTCGYVLK